MTVTNLRQNAVLATQAVELRIGRVREILRSFTAADINQNGFYDEPFAVALNLGKMSVAIKEAVQVINDNSWPNETETDLAPPVSAHIQKLRQRCAQEIRLALINLQHGLVVTSVPKVTLRNLLNINSVFDNPRNNPLITKGTLLFFNLKRNLGWRSSRLGPRSFRSKVRRHPDV
jgi:hypothetical protein